MATEFIKIELTAQQIAVYGAIGRLKAVNGFAPSIRELAAALGISTTRVRHHLARLESLHVISREIATARSIRLTPKESVFIVAKGSSS